MAKKMLQITALLLISFLTSSFTLVSQPVNYDELAERYQPEIASLVQRYLYYYHYQRLEPNDEISQKLLDAYLKNLDFSRMYFLQSDIDSFQKFATRLDDDLSQDPANLQAAFDIFAVFHKRVDQRVGFAREVMARDFDFTKDEHLSYDRTEVPWAKTVDELDDIWRRRIKEEVLRFELRGTDREEYLETLSERYDRLEKNYNDFESPDIVEMFLSSLAEVYDPHSSYLRPATKDNFDIQMGHSLEGIGATLTTEGEYTVIVDIVEGGPADLQGDLRPDDKIIAVAQGVDGKPSDVMDMRLDKVVKQIRGPKGTKVRLTVIPSGATDHSLTKEITIVRDRVELTSRDAKAEIKEIRREDGSSFRVGVIDIPSFYMDTRAKMKGDPQYKSTTRDVKALIDDLEDRKVDGLVIDLRRNGGGSLDEAIRLTGLFIHEGPIVQIKDFRDNVEVEKDPDPERVYKGPLVVLTSVFSASASEIFASAIQDYGRGVVVGGESTHGKGTVQNVISLQQQLARRARLNTREDIAGALKLTTHKFYRVSGGSTQFKGVLPDVVIPSPYDGLSVKEEHLDYALGWDEIDPAPHRDYGMVAEALPFLSKESAKRVAVNPEFRYLREDLEYRQRRKEENRISLNLEKRKAETDMLEKREEERDEARKSRDVPIQTVYPEPEPEPEDDKTEKKDENDDAEDSEPEEERVPTPDAVLEEALFIMVDYLRHQGFAVAVTSPAKKESL